MTDYTKAYKNSKTLHTFLETNSLPMKLEDEEYYNLAYDIIDEINESEHTDPLKGFSNLMFTMEGKLQDVEKVLTELDITILSKEKEEDANI